MIVMKISELPGCGPVIEKKLAANGILDVQQLVNLGAAKVADKTGLDNDSAIELCKKSRTFLEKKNEISSLMGQSGIDIPDEDGPIISTGTKSVDKLLNGGLRVGACTEIYGEDGCGKTQFSFTMAVRVQLPLDQGGANGKVIWIDTENTFRKDRIRSIAINLGLDPDKCLENILVVKPLNSTDQQTAIEESEKLVIKDKNIKLIIIDSAIGLFRGEYTGRGMLSERQKYLNRFLTLSHNIAMYYKIATIWTNQVMINPGVFYGDPIVPIGGKILGHLSTYRIYFRKSGKKRIGVLKKSPNDAQIEVTFGVSTEGLVDPEIIDEIEKEKKKAKKQ